MKALEPIVNGRLIQGWNGTERNPTEDVRRWVKVLCGLCLKHSLNRAQHVASVTCVDEASRRSLAELFGLIRECDLNNSGDVSRGCLDTNGVWGYQL